jgi:HEAT repeat protein
MILLDPGCTSEEVLGTVAVLPGLLFEFPVESERFVPLLVRRAARDSGFAPNLPDPTREQIVRLLGEFGDESSAAALVPILQEPNRNLWLPTAEALARTGGLSELQALNGWVIGHNPDDPYVVKVRRVRDQFEARILATRPAE